jgi:hypothetical protein
MLQVQQVTYSNVLEKTKEESLDLTNVHKIK